MSKAAKIGLALGASAAALLFLYLFLNKQEENQQGGYKNVDSVLGIVRQFI